MPGKWNRFEVGQRFGRWTVVSDVPIRAKSRFRYWLCRCDCGAEKAVRSTELANRRSGSCGCAVVKQGPGRPPRGARAGYKPTRELSYMAAHQRVRRHRGPASCYACVDCLSPAEDWTLRSDATDRHLDPAPGGTSRPMYYSGDPDDYEPRCRPCHRRYDKLGRTGES